MQDGSVNLQKGQKIGAGAIIGRVGNTGRTGNKQKGVGLWFKGKDWGNHMHLEIRVDGQRINPEDYYKEVFPASQNNNTQTQGYNQSTQYSNSNIVWSTPDGQKVVTQEEYNRMLQEVNEGKHANEGITAQRDLDAYYETSGLQRVQRNPQNKAPQIMFTNPTSNNNSPVANTSNDIQLQNNNNNNFLMGNTPDITADNFSDYENRLADYYRQSLTNNNTPQITFSDAHSPAPDYTDEINGTTPEARQASLDYLNGLNTGGENNITANGFISIPNHNTDKTPQVMLLPYSPFLHRLYQV